MAQPANTFDSYDYSDAIAEDISNTIYNGRPTRRRFTQSARKLRVCYATRMAYQLLRSSAANAYRKVTQLQQKRTAETRLGSYTNLQKQHYYLRYRCWPEQYRKARRMATRCRWHESRNWILKRRFLIRTRERLDRQPQFVSVQARLDADKREHGLAANSTGAPTPARRTAIAFTQAKFDSVMRVNWVTAGRW